MALAMLLGPRHSPAGQQVEVEYKKAMLGGGIMKSETRMNTQIRGQQGYSQSFSQKYEEDKAKQKNFSGFTKDKKWQRTIETQTIIKMICSSH